MKRALPVLAALLALCVPGLSLAQDTPTPTATATATATATPTSTATATPVSSSDAFAILVSDGGNEFKFVYTGHSPYLVVRNIGSASATLRLTAGITETTPATPTVTKAEYILPAGGILTLPRGTSQFWYRTASGATTSLSVSANYVP